VGGVPKKRNLTPKVAEKGVLGVDHRGGTAQAQCGPRAAMELGGGVDSTCGKVTPGVKMLIHVHKEKCESHQIVHDVANLQRIIGGVPVRAIDKSGRATKITDRGGGGARTGAAGSTAGVKKNF
jgi:hypothetical protein